MSTVDWLLDEADPALEYQATRDLLGGTAARCRELRKRIAAAGHGKLLLDRRGPDGHWGRGAYGPKWTCTHYVLFELLQLGLDPGNRECRESAELLLLHPRGKDGGVNYARTVEYADVCVNGMLLSLGGYFRLEKELLAPLVDFLIEVEMADGGWNCEYFRGAKRSSLHTTVAVLEGIDRYLVSGGSRRARELEVAKGKGIEFILVHELYKTRTTGEVIKDEFLKYTFPVRWKYDILRCLDYFREAGTGYDPRLEAALGIVEEAGRKTGRWKGGSQPGKTYYRPDSGKWNTLRALRVLDYFGRNGPETTAGRPRRRRKVERGIVRLGPGI